MADYLCPNKKLSVQDQHDLFAFRCKMNQLPSNYGNNTLCETNCGAVLTNSHLLNCKVLNEDENHSFNIYEIYNGSLNSKERVLRII